MKTLGSGKVVFYAPDGTSVQLTGEIDVRGDRVAVTEIIYFNGQPNGARETNLPLSQTVIYWEPEVYEQIGFE
ncbi:MULTISPECIES: hypothetical protein [Brevibacillus]|jgi:hypothetical protein|uniref:Uncharacterized protein n=1 Tax=Brevibacillus parabrevis TaxID=54914 RepID=A0A4Y3PJ70_BREPA|nr:MULTISPECIES: hypothetical protein [Brevibacillus]TGV02932.1 hypothetical protein EN829_056560 [Mesorhizobium sp. M00.F.Ca.ET.186.01.1.1]KZE50492.1 hypothetical protein AV540_13700 [Brevibacillus parabrevis]MBU8713009.1 hypothetical protein [Brevibacillus parabrevis]MDH6348528.1 hypothetical protein [Brevibacillus sp. 1238]MDR5002325.1 hypothetical protein [Brevibacillus parabrevis]